MTETQQQQQQQQQQQNERRKRKRWGDAPSQIPTQTDANHPADHRHNGHRMSSSSSSLSPSSLLRTPAPVAPLDAKAKAAALQQSISARLAALKAKKSQMLPAASATDVTMNGDSLDAVPPRLKKAKIYDLDLNVSGPTFRKGSESVKAQEAVQKKINPYLSHVVPLEENMRKDLLDSKKGEFVKDKAADLVVGGGRGDIAGENGEHDLLDARLAGGHMGKKRRKKGLQFVEPGTYIQRAERKRAKMENATQSGFVSGRKLGLFVKPTGMTTDDRLHDHDERGDHDYYQGSSSMEYLDHVKTLAKTVPRVDTVHEARDGSSKGTGGVVVIPTPWVMEWWDLDLLPTKLKKEVIAVEGQAVTSKASRRMKLKERDSDVLHDQRVLEKTAKDLIETCATQASIQNSKTHKLVQHPVPVKPPNAPKEPVASTLHLTKKEMKRQRKLRRAEKQRELQDMQAAGLIPALEPKLTLSNFMRVLGDQAIMDPSKMEAKVMEQIQARKLKHEKMNAERKLTKEQRAEKLDRKLTEDTSHAVSVALFLVNDMSHRYHRTKVDLNAQQNKITGGVLECECPKLCLVICEGGPKAIKRFTRLMTVRMNWTGEGILNTTMLDGEDDGNGLDMVDLNGEQRVDGEISHATSQKFNPENSCELVWTGMAPKRMFRTFVFQKCDTSEDARRILEAKGVAHFWDQVLVHASGSDETFHFKLGTSSKL